MKYDNFGNLVTFEDKTGNFNRDKFISKHVVEWVKDKLKRGHTHKSCLSHPLQDLTCDEILFIHCSMFD